MWLSDRACLANLRHEDLSLNLRHPQRKPDVAELAAFAERRRGSPRKSPVCHRSQQSCLLHERPRLKVKRVTKPPDALLWSPHSSAASQLPPHAHLCEPSTVHPALPTHQATYHRLYTKPDPTTHHDTHTQSTPHPTTTPHSTTLYPTGTHEPKTD